MFKEPLMRWLLRYWFVELVMKPTLLALFLVCTYSILVTQTENENSVSALHKR